MCLLLGSVGLASAQGVVVLLEPTGLRRVDRRAERRHHVDPLMGAPAGSREAEAVDEGPGLAHRTCLERAAVVNGRRCRGGLGGRRCPGLSSFLRQLLLQVGLEKLGLGQLRGEVDLLPAERRHRGGLPGRERFEVGLGSSKLLPRHPGVDHQVTVVLDHRPEKLHTVGELGEGVGAQEHLQGVRSGTFVRLPRSDLESGLDATHAVPKAFDSTRDLPDPGFGLGEVGSAAA